MCDFVLFCFFAVLFLLVSSCDIGEPGMGPAPLSFLGSEPIAILLVSVYPTLLFFLLLAFFPRSVLFFRFVSHSLSLLLSFCPGCIPLLIGLPYLRSLLRRMFFLPYAYHYVVALFFFFCVCFVCVCVPCCCCCFFFFFFYSSVSLPGDDVPCWQFSCPFSYLFAFPAFFSPNVFPV